MPRLLKLLKKDRNDGTPQPSTSVGTRTDAQSATGPNRDSVEPPSQTPASGPSHPAKNVGLFELAKGKGDGEKTVDVVAVHGLQGNAYKTWTHENGTMWLESILPDKIPFARVMTFGYDSTIAFSSSAATLEDVALELMNRLSMKRSSVENGSTRPIVFVCHSLGGILVKKALILAHERSSDTHYQNILDNTKALAFLGVPHRGADAAWWFSFVASALKSATLGTSTHTTLIKNLQNASPTLAAISKQFVDRGQHLKIYTFYETRKLLGTVIVDRESAVLNLSNEKLFPIDANHRTICHIPSTESHEYEALGAWITDLARSVTMNSPVKLPLLKSYFEVPNRRVLQFFGREDIPKTIDKGFSVGPAPHVVVIQGMGGQGKSQVAIEYCHRKRDAPFSTIFWIDAISESAVTGTFVTLSELISNQDDYLPSNDAKIAFVRRRFASWPSKLLLVFDNYDDPENFPNIRDFFPLNELCAILVTGRHADIGTLVLGQDDNLIELPGLEESAAVDLLEYHSQFDETTRKFGEEIVKRLGCHPLAIAQAGTYIRKGGIQLTEFLDVYNQEKEEILKSTPQLSQYRRKLEDAEKETSLNVFTTWQLSFQQLLSNTPEDSTAVKLLRLLAFFDNKDISEWTFINYHDNHYDSKTYKLLEWINRYANPVSCWSSRLFRKDLVLLKDFCLLQSYTQGSDGYSHISLHPLVKDWIRLQMKDSTCQEYAFMSAGILGDFLQISWKNGHFELPLTAKQHLLLHVVAQEDNNKDYLWTNFAELCADLVSEYLIYQSWLESFLRNEGFYNNAEIIEMRSLKLKRVMLGEEHLDTTSSMSNLALTFWHQGRFKEAEVLQVQVLEMRKRVLGEEHPDTLVSMNNLASTFSNQGRLKEAEELEVQVLETKKRVLGEEHPDTLNSMNNLARTFSNQGRFEEAEVLEVQVFEIRKRVLGEEHPDTLISINNLASTISDQGRFEEAEVLQVRLLERGKRVLGEEHPNTLSIISNLASTFSDQGRFKEAEVLEMRVLETRKRVLGEEHPDTLSIMNNLASTFSDQGRFEEAEVLRVRSLEIGNRVLGEEHPKTLSIMSNLASTFSDQGRFEEAEVLKVQVLEARKRVLGEEHPDTLSSMNNLASTFSGQGRFEEAEVLQVRVLEARKRVLGKEHPDALLVMNNLASTFLYQRRFEEAEVLQVRVLDARKRVLGEEHPDTLGSMNNLASTFSDQGRLKEAEVLQVRVLEARKRVLGEEHPYTLNTINNLAYTYRNMNESEKAVELMEKVVELRSKVLGVDHPDTHDSKETLRLWTST